MQSLRDCGAASGGKADGVAIYHFSAQAVGRGKGRSAVAAAAYRAGERLEDARTGLTHDYRAKGGVAHSEIIMPPSAGDWRPSRSELWNAAEKANGRGDAIIAREFEISLPHELTDKQRRDLARDMASYIAEKYSVAVDFAIHRPGEEGDDRNHHMHLLITAKRIKRDRFGTKATELDPYSADYRGANKGKANAVAGLREVWAALANDALEQAGHDARIDHRSFEDRYLDREPTVHLGPHATAMERKGEETERGDLNREAKANNKKRAAIKSEIAVIGQEIRDEAQARAERQAEREMQSAVRTFEPVKILDAITERRSTFSRGDLNHLLKGEVADKNERAEVVARILSHSDVIGLRETADSPVTRYTTRAVLAAEMEVMQASRKMGAATRYGLTDYQKAGTLDQHAHLDHEQRAAFDRATGAGGFAIIAGEAGTGKSTTMGAIRDGYTAAGYRVIGLAWTNAVVQDMAADGFTEASTIARELRRIEKGSSAWNERTVLMVDEAAMLSTKHLATLMTQAQAAGAKVILTGDDAQLASIERGGLFGALRMEHGAAVLSQVRRISDAEERRAWNKMHDGDFRPIVDLLDSKGAIHWGQRDEDARAALVAKYAADTARDPAKSRFIFANSNLEVAALNRAIRAIRRERGELGEDRILKGADGEAAFAKNDRIQFTGSARTQAARDAGFTNGAVGTILEIDGQRVTLALDGKGKGPGRVVAFTVGDDAEAGQFNHFRHGYAGTIYKGQGRTLDQTYVLHSASMGAASSYVGLSRHRESVALFTTRGADAWMNATGGTEGLTEAQHKSAERSYARWAKAKPELAARHGFADYVAYVQDQHAKRPADHSADLDRLARQMGRVDDRRSASQFQPSPVKDTGSFDGAARSATGPQEGREGIGGTSATAGAGNAPTGRQTAAAHGIGARIAAMRNPFRQAEALHRAHVRDAHTRRLAELVAKRAAEAKAAEQSEARRQSQLEREQMQRDIAARMATRKPDPKADSTPATPTPEQRPSDKPKTLAEIMAEKAERNADAVRDAERERSRERFRDRGRTR